MKKTIAIVALATLASCGGSTTTTPTTTDSATVKTNSVKLDSTKKVVTDTTKKTK